VSNRTCSVEGCDRIHYAKGLCNLHWRRQRQYGSPDLPSRLDRFWSKVEKTDGGCWNWTGALGATPRGQDGYGIFNAGDGSYVRAHRFAYELLRGHIPAAMHLDHTCFNPSCVNPDHLRPATNGQNVQNHRGARKTSKSGVRGVYFDKARNKWAAQVTAGSKVVFAKRFDTIEEAEAAVIAARNQVHTHNDADRTWTSTA
jgi:hypothetical protein